jgi:hypothetical protein
MLQTIKSFVPTPVKEAIKSGGRAVTGNLRLMPDFIVIGGQKCGTTSLYHYLMSHPYIISPTIKQIHFFDNNFDKGVTWYRTHFPSYFYKYYLEQKYKKPIITGEATPYYIFHPVAPKRIAQFVPKAKFILLLRNPIDRAYSHYHHELRKGTEKLTFEQVVDQEPERLAGEREKMIADETYYSANYQRYSYLARGIYVDQINEWFKYFPREQILIIKSEDMHSELNATVNQILDFLNVPKHPDFHLKSDQFYNVGKYDKMDTKMRERLTEYYRPHNERLYKLLNRDFGWK